MGIDEVVLTVRPEGLEASVNMTGSVKPSEGVIETLNVILPPLVKLTTLGLALREKSALILKLVEPDPDV
jgi:hypothetical protein